jgi:hypothetical protein
MSTVNAAELLDTWEAGGRHGPLQRGLALLSTAYGTSLEAAAELPVGQRDRALFAFRAALFGTSVEAVSRCPGCGTEVELAFDQRDLLAYADPLESDHTVVVREDGREVRVRMPTSADLAAVLDADVPDPAAGLVRRCVPAGEPVPCGKAVAEAWASADPLLEVRIAVVCPECAQGWQEPFDIIAFLWTELDAWGRRVLLEVHELARAYGWTQTQILELSPWRRQCYLGLVGA